MKRLGAVQLTGSITLDSKIVKPNNTISATVTLGEHDNEVQFQSCKWVVTDSKNALGKKVSSYTGGNLNNDGSIETTAGATEGDYYLHILLVDINSNKKEIISEH